MLFFQGVLLTPNFLHKQSQRHIFVLSKPNDNGRHLCETTFAVTHLENVIFSSEILFYLSGNVLIPEDEKKLRDWFTVTYYFCSILLFFTAKLRFVVGV